MTAAYTPEPGTVAFRVLAYLETLPKGTEVMTSALAEALGLEGRNVAPCLETALAKSVVFRRQRDTHVRSPFWWSLTDYSAIPKAERPVLEVPQVERTRRKDLKALDAGHQAGGEAAQAPHVVEPGPAAASTPTNGRLPARTDPRRGPDTGAQVDGCRAPERHAGPCSGRLQQDQTSLPASPNGMRIALWSDGWLELHGLSVTGAGFARLAPEQTRQLVAYLERLGEGA